MLTQHRWIGLLTRKANCINRAVLVKFSAWDFQSGSGSYSRSHSQAANIGQTSWYLRGSWFSAIEEFDLTLELYSAEDNSTINSPFLDFYKGNLQRPQQRLRLERANSADRTIQYRTAFSVNKENKRIAVELTWTFLLDGQLQSRVRRCLETKSSKQHVGKIVESR